MTVPIDRLLRRTCIDFKQSLEFARDPLIITRAEGLYYWDTRGRRYFDAIGGIFVAVLGHRHPRVIEAMHRQMDRLTFAPPRCTASPTSRWSTSTSLAPSPPAP